MESKLNRVALQSLIESLFDQKNQWSRSALIDETLRFYEERGTPVSTTTAVSIVKKVLRELTDKNRLVSIGKGLWARVEGDGETVSEGPKEIPLQPLYVMDKVAALFHEKATWERQALTDRIVADHLAAGHVLGAQTPSSVVKKVLGRLRTKGLVENVGKGYWQRTVEPTSIIAGVSDKLGGIPLQPTLARSKILQLFSRRTSWKRTEIVEHVVSEHLAEGNLLGTQDPAMVVKKALTYLQDSGKVSSDGKGTWQLVEAPEQAAVIPESVSLVECVPLDVDGVSDVEPEASRGSGNWVELGQGSESVYLYYFDNDKELSTLKGRATWACKIGYTTDDVVRRVSSQTKTARAYKPIIAVVIRSDNAFYLEAIIHNSFKLIDRHFGERDGVGYEWFDTSPEELVRWYTQFESLMKPFQVR
jgi:hypothetical protein